jgi:DNA polymerase-3 subunit gamma/tau
LLDLVHAEPLIPVQELVSRLDALATGAAGPTGTGGTRGATPASVPPTRSSPGPGRSAAPPTPATPPPTELPAPVPDSPFVRELLDLVPAEFALRPPGDPPAETPSGPPADLGPPSSRSVPREPIAWRTMDPFVAWGALLEGIRGEDEPLFAVLAELGLARLSPGVLELAAPHASFARAQLAEHPELRAGLHRFLEELFGEPFELRLVDAAPNLPELPSLALVEVERRRTRQAEVETRAGQNPRIRALIAAFDARIREVRPLDADRGSGP